MSIDFDKYSPRQMYEMHLLVEDELNLQQFSSDGFTITNCDYNGQRFKFDIKYPGSNYWKKGLCIKRKEFLENINKVISSSKIIFFKSLFI